MEQQFKDYLYLYTLSKYLENLLSNQSKHYNKYLTPTAQKLRKSMTKAEACIWKYVLKSKQTGYSFRRQRPIDKYVVDFCCFPKMLIVEIDGSSHSHRETYKKDKQRQVQLESLGYKILRFTNEEVLNNINGVKNEIMRYLESE